MLERQDRLQRRLDDLIEDDRFLGSAIVSRDGIPVLSSFADELNHRAFSILVEGAMVATLMGAAEEGMAELEGGELEHTTVAADELRLTVAGLSEDLLFVVVSAAGDPLEETLASLRETLAEIEEGA